jgi:hypothetical protein
MSVYAATNMYKHYTFKEILHYFDVSTVHLGQFIIQTKKKTHTHTKWPMLGP